MRLAKSSAALHIITILTDLPGRRGESTPHQMDSLPIAQPFKNVTPAACISFPPLSAVRSHSTHTLIPHAALSYAHDVDIHRTKNRK